MVLQVLRRLVVCALLGGALLLVTSLACTGGDEDEPPPATPTAAATATPTATTETPSPTATRATANPLTSTPTAAVTPTATAAPASTAAPTPTPTVALTIEGYAEWCGARVGTAGSADEFLDGWRRVEPPDELRDFHDAMIRVGVVGRLIAYDSPYAILGDDSLDIWLAIALLLSVSAGREVATLPEDVLAELADGGCIEGWSPELGPADAEAEVTALLSEILPQILSDFEPEIMRLLDLHPQPPRLASVQPTPRVADAPASGRTLQDVLDRGYLLCGTKQTQPLFGWKENDGSVVGFDIEFCKAIAAAVLGDAAKVEYVDASDASKRFEYLLEAEFDVLIRTTAVTASRDRALGIDFAQPIFYSGQGFLVRADSGYDSTSGLGDAVICVQADTVAEQNVADYFREIGLRYDRKIHFAADVWDAFLSGRCDVLTANISDIASRVYWRNDGVDYKFLPPTISREPLAPAVRDDDGEWKDVVNWVVHGLIAAEELGITQANVAAMAADPPNTEIARLLGVPYEGREVSTLGFDAVGAQFIQRAIAAVGNYGEIYERTIGDWIPRACSLNALAIDRSVDCPPGLGGILYALPHR